MLSTRVLSAACACLLLITCGHAALKLSASEGAQPTEGQQGTARVASACAIHEAEFGHGVVRVARADADTTPDQMPIATGPSTGGDATDFGTEIKAWKAAWAACVNHVGRRLSRHCAAVLARQGAFASDDPPPRKATADADVYRSLSNLREDRSVQSSGSSGTCPLCLTPPC
jgi:hypothetical protein